MPLHRDIFWVGRQWAVTGHGMQAIDQKLNGQFDIEISRIWEDDLHDALRDEKWLNAGDFDRGLAEARKHYPQPPGKVAPEARPVLVAPPLPDESMAGKQQPEANLNPAPANLAMRIIGCRAKFLPTWRIRIVWKH